MGILQWFLGKKKQFPISTTFKETIAFFGSSLNFWIISIPHVISKTTSAKDSKERPISKKWWQLNCSQGLCWRLVELSSPTNGVFSSAGKLCIVYSLAALSKLWPASVGMFLKKTTLGGQTNLCPQNLEKDNRNSHKWSIYQSLHSNDPWIWKRSSQLWTLLKQ